MTSKPRYFDRRETNDDPGEMMRVALRAAQSSLWTAMPAFITKFDPVKQTVEAQPTIQGKFQQSDGSYVWTTMPVCADVPLVFPNAGGFSLTFPVAAGDEVLLVFASRCIDSWWQSGGIQVQAELRLHDLSDGFAIPGPRSQPRKLPSYSATDVQLRNEDGTSIIAIKPNGDVTVDTEAKIIATAAEADVTAPTINLIGNVNIEGNLVVSGTGTMLDMITAVVPTGYNTHQHGGVRGGSDKSHGPVSP